MKQKAILATTHIDKHGMRITKEALDKAAEDINSGKKLLLTIEHDLTIPPYGKTLEAYVEAREDGEFQLVVTKEYFEEVWWGKLPDGTPIFRQESKIDRHPFADRYEEKPEIERVEFDELNFESQQELSAFVSEAMRESQIEFDVGIFGRKSLIPDPEFLIWLTKAVGIYLVSRKITDKVVDKLGELATDEATKFYLYIKSVVLSAARNARKGRPITYIFVLPNDPTIEFIARSVDPNIVISALLFEKMEKALTHLNYFRESLGAVRIQYLLNDSGEWVFNYLLTREGAVIGTEHSLNRRHRRIEILNRDSIEKAASKDTAES